MFSYTEDNIRKFWKEQKKHILNIDSYHKTKTNYNQVQPKQVDIGNQKIILEN